MIRNTDHLSAVGPTSEDHHFPLWYKDSLGVRLALALDPNDAFAPTMGELPVPGAPVSFPGNFPEESFYMSVQAQMTTGGTAAPGRARLVLALEAAFGGTGEVVEGQQLVFGRVRVRIDGAVPGAGYTFTHPYGQTDPLLADDRGRVFVTEDIGTVPLAFAEALGSQVAPFLRWTSGAARAPGEFDPPPGYLGDGVTPHTITGSPLGFNFFRIEGPDIADAGGPRDPDDPANINKILTPLFTVQGRLATVAGVDVPRAVYFRTAGGAVTVDVFATSEPGQVIEIGGPGISPTAMRGEQERYVARAAAGTAVPPSVEVSNIRDAPPTRKTAAVTDAVTIARADYDLATGTLVVEAASSDEGTPPTLTAVDLGPLTAGQGSFPVGAPPVTVQVTSSGRGSARRTVAVTGPPMSRVVALAGPDQTVQQGQTVSLDGAGSGGAVTSFSWAQTAGPAVTLGSATAAATTFVAPAAGSGLSFDLTVGGPDGSSTDTVDVQVAALAPPLAHAGDDISAVAGATVTLDGTASASAAGLLWSQISGPQVTTLTGADTARPSFTMPSGAGPVVMRLTASGPGGSDDTDEVTVSGLVDTLTVDTAQFRTSKQQWRIGGTATGSLPDLIEVDFGGRLIGGAQVDATGAWDVRRTILSSEPGLRPTPAATVTVTSSRGASRIEPVNIRN